MDGWMNGWINCWQLRQVFELGRLMLRIEQIVAVLVVDLQIGDVHRKGVLRFLRKQFALICTLHNLAQIDVTLIV